MPCVGNFRIACREGGGGRRSGTVGPSNARGGRRRGSGGDKVRACASVSLAQGREHAKRQEHLVSDGYPVPPRASEWAAHHARARHAVGGGATRRRRHRRRILAPTVVGKQGKSSHRGSGREAEQVDMTCGSSVVCGTGRQRGGGGPRRSSHLDEEDAV
jgi:hypothetical protein